MKMKRQRMTMEELLELKEQIANLPDEIKAIGGDVGSKIQYLKKESHTVQSNRNFGTNNSDRYKIRTKRYSHLEPCNFAHSLYCILWLRCRIGFQDRKIRTALAGIAEKRGARMGSTIRRSWGGDLK